MPSWQRDFASGLIVLVPLLVTIIFLAWIYSHLARVPIPLEYGPVRVLLTLVIFILLSFSVGYLMRTAMGAVLENAIDDLMNQLPGLRVIYNASKMAVETALGGTTGLQKPVRLEVWDGLRMTAFKTGNRAPDGREILFLPTAPNITTGFVVEVEEERYVEIDDTVEDALTRLLSAGFGDNNQDIPVAELFAEQEVDVRDIDQEVTDDDNDGSTVEEPPADEQKVDEPKADELEGEGVEVEGTGPNTESGGPENHGDATGAEQSADTSRDE